MNTAPVRVLVADDSATARALLVALLAGDPGIEIVGVASNGQQAVEMTAELAPSIVVMDFEMPVLGGLDATARIMAESPTPIVIVTASADPNEVELAFRAVQLGALAVHPKPRDQTNPDHRRQSRRLVTVVKALADVRVVRRRWPAQPAARPPVRHGGARTTVTQAIGVAASTGGPSALYAFLGALPPSVAAPVFVVQHIADGFVAGLAAWLDSATPLGLRVAEHRERVRTGTVYVAPDGAHLEVAHGHIRLSEAPPIGGFRPSASALFTSLAREYGAGAAAVVLTGMGSDGLTGVRAVRAAGGLVLAQDEHSSVVFGMPRVVAEAGLADRVGPAGQLALWAAGSAPPDRTSTGTDG